MADFSSDVSSWCVRAGDLADQVFRAIAFDTVAAVQRETPVDTGFLRSNWTCMKQGESEPVAGRVPPPGVAIVAAHVGDVLIIINPVVYARRIEFGFIGEDKTGRSYNQPGRHMVQHTLDRMPEIAEAAYRRIVQGGGS